MNGHPPSLESWWGKLISFNFCIPEKGTVWKIQSEEKGGLCKTVDEQGSYVSSYSVLATKLASSRQ